MEGSLRRFITGFWIGCLDPGFRRGGEKIKPGWRKNKAGVVRGGMSFSGGDRGWVLAFLIWTIYDLDNVLCLYDRKEERLQE